MSAWIHYHARRTPGREALRDLGSGRSLTYAQLDDRVRRLAAGLAAEYGVTAGDRVVVLAGNSTNTIEVQYACALLGAIFVPLNWRLTVEELTAIVADAEPRLLVHDGDNQPAAAALSARHDLSLLSWAGAPDGYEQLLATSTPLDAPDGPHAATGGPDDPRADDPWTIIYTSGTTGRPKGALVSHRSGLFTILNTVAAGDVHAESVGLTCIPLFHTAGLNIFTNATLYTGGLTLVMRGYDPAQALRLISDGGGVTHLTAVPAQFQRMQELPEFATAPLRPVWAGVGGAPSPPPLYGAWKQRGVILRQIYGITEGSSTVCVMPAGRADEKVGSVGMPVVHARLRVVGADGVELPTGEVGELQIKGPNVSPGYWRRPEATAETFVGGWLRTGDAARLDADGFCTIVDRWKDMYISGGENVYPAEVENCIYQLEEVAEAAVVGKPDERWGETGLAAIVVKSGRQLTAEQVLEHCAAALAKYKIPTEVRFLDALPRNAIGKIRKVDIVHTPYRS